MSRSCKRIALSQFRRSLGATAMTPLAAAVITALHPTGPALAQESRQQSDAIEEILVTATKREINLQDVPHSIDVLASLSQPASR